MAVAVELDVKNALLDFEETLLDVVNGAWGDWLGSPYRSRISRYPRVRANLVHAFIVERAISAFDANPDIHIVHQDETAKFLFRQKVLVRFKKGDSNHLGSNIETQAVLAFTDPQMTIPGLPDVQKVDVVYVLNDLQTAVNRIAVTARDNDVRLWTYDIEDRRSAPVLPLVHPSAPSEGGNVVRLRTQAKPQASSGDNDNKG